MEFSKFVAGFTLIRKFLIKTNKIWTLDTKCEGGTRITHRSGPSLSFPRPCFRAPWFYNGCLRLQ